MHAATPITYTSADPWILETRDTGTIDFTTDAVVDQDFLFLVNGAVERQLGFTFARDQDDLVANEGTFFATFAGPDDPSVLLIGTRYSGSFSGETILGLNVSYLGDPTIIDDEVQFQRVDSESAFLGDAQSVTLDETGILANGHFVVTQRGFDSFPSSQPAFDVVTIFQVNPDSNEGVLRELAQFRTDLGLNELPLMVALPNGDTIVSLREGDELTIRQFDYDWVPQGTVTLDFPSDNTLADLVVLDTGDVQIIGQSATGDPILLTAALGADLAASDGPDILEGTDDADTLDGQAGDDVIHGRAGDDLLFGSTGNDLIFGNSGDDEIDGGDTDRTTLTKVFGGDGDDVIRGARFVGGGRGDDRIHGVDGSGDQLSGWAGNDWIAGGSGADTLRGNQGDDWLMGQSQRDTIYGGAGDDTIFGGQGFDTLFGGDGRDVLRGGTGNDRVFGGDGDDVIYGGHGGDALFGGNGNDTFFVDANQAFVPAQYPNGRTEEAITTGDGADQIRLRAYDDFIHSSLSLETRVTDFDVSQDIIGIYGPDRDEGSLSVIRSGTETLDILHGRDVLGQISDTDDDGALLTLFASDVELILEDVDTDDLEDADFLTF